jgi:hypothetical protein
MDEKYNLKFIHTFAEKSTRPSDRDTIWRLVGGLSGTDDEVKLQVLTALTVLAENGDFFKSCL